MSAGFAGCLHGPHIETAVRTKILPQFIDIRAALRAMRVYALLFYAAVIFPARFSEKDNLFSNSLFVLRLKGFFCWSHCKYLLFIYAAFLRGFSSSQRSETDNSSALAMALRQYRDLVMPLIVWWIVTRCRLHLRPISAADKPFFHISVLIFNSMSNMYLLYSCFEIICQLKYSCFEIIYL